MPSGWNNSSLLTAHYSFQKNALPVIVILKADDAIIDNFFDFVENHLAIDVGHHESLGACLTVGIIRIERVGVFEHPLAIVIVIFLIIMIKKVVAP
jgi:hypothetical protein